METAGVEDAVAGDVDAVVVEDIVSFGTSGGGAVTAFGLSLAGRRPPLGTFAAELVSTRWREAVWSAALILSSTTI